MLTPGVMMSIDHSTILLVGNDWAGAYVRKGIGDTACCDFLVGTGSHCDAGDRVIFCYPCFTTKNKDATSIAAVVSLLSPTFSHQPINFPHKGGSERNKWRLL